MLTDCGNEIETILRFCDSAILRFVRLRHVDPAVVLWFLLVLSFWFRFRSCIQLRFSFFSCIQLPLLASCQKFRFLHSVPLPLRSTLSLLHFVSPLFTSHFGTCPLLPFALRHAFSRLISFSLLHQGESDETNGGEKCDTAYISESTTVNQHSWGGSHIDFGFGHIGLGFGFRFVNVYGSFSRFLAFGGPLHGFSASSRLFRLSRLLFRRLPGKCRKSIEMTQSRNEIK